MPENPHEIRELSQIVGWPHGRRSVSSETNKLTQLFSKQEHFPQSLWFIKLPRQRQFTHVLPNAIQRQPMPVTG
jgi:hypothetical protein